MCVRRSLAIAFTGLHKQSDAGHGHGDNGNSDAATGNEGACGVSPGPRMQVLGAGLGLRLRGLKLFPRIPLLHDLAADNSREVDADEGDGLAAFPNCDMGCHPGRDLFSLYELIVDLERVLIVDEQIVEVEDALAKLLKVPVARRGVPDVVGCDHLVQCRKISGCVDVNQAPEDGFPGFGSLGLYVSVHLVSP